MNYSQLTERELLLELQRINAKYREDCEPILRALERARGFYAEPRLELVERESERDDGPKGAA